MSDILDDYRVRQARRPDRVQTHYIGCHMHHDDCMAARMAEEITRLRAEVERLRLTEAELEAVQTSVDKFQDSAFRPLRDVAATLRGLLARHGDGE